MDTLSERMHHLRDNGWTGQFSIEDGAIHCHECARDATPEDVVVDQFNRFEGQSDPGDESILFAITMPCGHRGALPVSFGKDAEPEDADVARRLRLGAT